MFPASDPGGNAKHDNATVSMVATDKDGRVMPEFGSHTNDFVIGDAPSSDADDAFFPR